MIKTLGLCPKPRKGFPLLTLKFTAENFVSLMEETGKNPPSIAWNAIANGSRDNVPRFSEGLEAVQQGLTVLIRKENCRC